MCLMSLIPLGCHLVSPSEPWLSWGTVMCVYLRRQENPQDLLANEPSLVPALMEFTFQEEGPGAKQVTQKAISRHLGAQENGPMCVYCGGRGRESLQRCHGGCILE